MEALSLPALFVGILGVVVWGLIEARRHRRENFDDPDNP